MVVVRRCVLALVCLALLAHPWLSEAAAQSKVVVESAAGKHRLLRNGEPYFIRGAGGDSHLAALAAAGGNSIRTWGTDNLGAILDDTQRHGLTVCVGLWLGHERHGFDYQDQAAVLKQLDACTETVRRYKDHPAVLMWGVGNEMEGDGKQPGGLNLTGATELEFWVRGARGGETVDFVLGSIDGDVPYRDTAKGELKNVRLTAEWQKLRIPLDGRDLSRIKTGFGWSLAGQGQPVAFYLDDIRYVVR